MFEKCVHCSICFLGLFLALAALAVPCRAQEMTVAPDNPSGIYHVGDTVRWTITWAGPGAPPDSQYVVESGGLTDIGHGELSFTGDVATLDTTFDSPNTQLLVVTWQPEIPANRAVGGAVAAPDRITPAAPPPADFDSFWSAQLKRLAEVPTNPHLKEQPSGTPGVSYWKVRLDNIGGAHVQGQIARPAGGDKFPALLILQWAGVYPLQKEWVTGRAADGWLALDIEPHDIPIDKPQSFYDSLSAGPLKNYWDIGNDDREKSYYLRMYLSCVQALEYLRQRPDWDGKTLVVLGASQGGQQALALAGLKPDEITAALVLVPAACDMLAPSIGRASGFPWWYNNTQGKDPAKVRAASLYFDPANFARQIRCPVLVGLGLEDQTAPPSSILAAASRITSPKQVVILARSGHQDVDGSQKPYNDLCEHVWLPALLAGKPAPVAPAP